MKRILLLLIGLTVSSGLIAQKANEGSGNSTSASGSGAVQMENDGLRKYGTNDFHIYFDDLPSNKNVYEFNQNSILHLNNGGQIFGLGVNDDGQMEFLPNGTDSFGNPTMVIDDNNARVAIGLSNPGTTFEVASPTAGNGINISRTGAGFGSGRISIWSDRNAADEWRPGYIESGDNNDFTGRLDFFTNGTGSGAKIGSVLGMSVVDGKVGVGSSSADSPDFPLHVTSSNTISSSSSSTEGSFAIGATTSTHLNFDNNEINAWSGTAGATLYLNFWSLGKVQIGKNEADGANLDVNGFTNLGYGAPNIKMKKLTGTTHASAGGFVDIAHGLDHDKILDVSVLVNSSGSSWVGPEYTNGDSDSYKFHVYITSTNVRIYNHSGANFTLNRAVKVLLTYE